MRDLSTLVLGLVLLLAGCETTTVTSEPDRPEATDTDVDGDGQPDDTEPQGQQTAAVGDAITLQGADDELQVSVTVDEMIDPATPGNDFDDPGEGRRYVALRLTLANVGDVDYSDSPGNGATLIDASNQQYDVAILGGDLAECQSLGSSVTMPPGDTRTGCIGFALPADAAPDRFQFVLDSGFGPQTAVWRLAG
ncbi:MAG TPA: DUF4352 domain-containing protein [Nitriliruptorales bacterium]